MMLMRITVPETGRRCRGDRDAALLLLLHPVHGGGAVMHFADLVRDTGVVENPLCCRRLSGVNVSHDSDISCIFEGCDVPFY